MPSSAYVASVVCRTNRKEIEHGNGYRHPN